MKPSSLTSPSVPEADLPAPQALSPVARLALLGAGAVGASAAAGWGLQHALPSWPGLGATTGALVAGALVPLLWWAHSRLAAPPPQRQPTSGLGPEAQRAARDALTGAYTQQHFVAATDREWSRIRRHGEDAALLMVDIDHFKTLNERWGMPCGDAVLVETTRQVSSTLRQYDLLARFGGGVLVVYLPHTDPMGALDVAERIRERVSALRVAWNGNSVKATISVGVAGIGASHGSLDEAIADAGTALREAKAAGRNCVRAAPIPPRRTGSGLSMGDRRPAGPV